MRLLGRFALRERGDERRAFLRGGECVESQHFCRRRCLLNLRLLPQGHGSVRFFDRHVLELGLLLGLRVAEDVRDAPLLVPQLVQLDVKLGQVRV